MLKKIPLLVLAINTKCNQKCVYCPPMGEGHICLPSDLKIEAAYKIVEVAFEQGVYAFRISGGEPLLHPEFDQYIDLMRSFRSKGCYVSLNTNAVYLNKFLHLLNSNNINLLRISLDSLDQQRYVQITGTNLLTSVKTNIKTAAEKGLKIRINTVIMKCNIDEIEKLIDYCSEIGAELKILDLEKHDYDDFNFWEDQYVPLTKLQKYLHKISEFNDIALSWGGQGMAMTDYIVKGVKIRLKSSLVSSTYNEYCKKKCPRFPCPEGIYGLIITPDQKVTWCRRIPQTSIPFEIDSLSAKEAFSKGIEVIHSAGRIEHTHGSITWNNEDSLLPLKKINTEIENIDKNIKIESDWRYKGNQHKYGRDDY